MKRFYAVIFSTLTLAGSVLANEPVTNNTPAPKTPTAHEWQKENDRIMGHIRSNKLTAMKSLSTSIMSIFHDSILTGGDVNPVWHGEYFSGPQTHFGISCVFNNSDNDLTIFANDISPLLAGKLAVNGQEYTLLKTSATVHGNTTFDFDLDNNLHVKAWLVTGDSTALPYIPVTRAAYLAEALKELETLKEAATSEARTTMHIRSAAEQEAEKQQMLEHLKSIYSGTELEARTRVYLRNYTKDEDLVLQTIDRNTANYTGTILTINRILRNSTEKELALPAVVSVNAEDFRGFEDGKANATTLVRMNPAFLNGNDDQAPKCLLICWRYNPTETLAAGIGQQLNENLNGQSFQALLAR